MSGKITNLFSRRQARVRHRLSRTARGKPRLSVFRSSKHIYAQVIDDLKGSTLAAASSLDKSLKGNIKTGADKAAAVTLLAAFNPVFAANAGICGSDVPFLALSCAAFAALPDGKSKRRLGALVLCANPWETEITAAAAPRPIRNSRRSMTNLLPIRS